MYMYQGRGLPKDAASYTFRYKIGSNERTLSGKEIEDIHLRLTDFLKAKDIELR